MIHKYSILITLSLLATFWSTSTAAAQGDEERARELFREGVEHLRSERYSEAAEAFERSHEVAPAAATLCNLALTHERSGRPTQAAETYDRCAAEDGSGRYREHAVDRAAELREGLDGDPGNEAGGEPGEAPPDPFVGPARPDGPPGDAGQGGEWGSPPPATAGERSHTLLWVGAAFGVGAVLSLGGGLVLMEGARADEAELERAYPDGQIPSHLPDGSRNPDAERLADAESRADAGIALYVVSGALAALGTSLVLVDLLSPVPDPSAPSVSLAPRPDGGLLFTRIRFE